MGDIRLIKPWYRSESHRYNCVLEHPIFGFTFELLYIVHLTFMGMAWNKDFIIIIYIYLYYYIYIYTYMRRKTYILSGLWIPRYYELVSYISENATLHKHIFHIKTTLFKQWNIRNEIKNKRKICYKVTFKKFRNGLRYDDIIDATLSTIMVSAGLAYMAEVAHTTGPAL